MSKRRARLTAWGPQTGRAARCPAASNRRNTVSRQHSARDRSKVGRPPGEPRLHAVRDRHVELYCDGAAVAQRRQMKMAVVLVSLARGGLESCAGEPLPGRKGEILR